jgi:hypothetical protein
MADTKIFGDKTNVIQSRSNRLLVYDPAMLAFLLNNKTYRPIIEATRSVKGQQLFIPYIYDIIQGKKLSLVKVYPPHTTWSETTDYSGKEVYEFHPADDLQRAFQASWTEINRIFTAEMLRMQATVLNGKTATEFVMVDKDKISRMSEAIKSKCVTSYDSSRDFLTAQLSMVYFMITDDQKAVVGIKLNEGFPIDPTYKVSGKRKASSAEVVEESKA